MEFTKARRQRQQERLRTKDLISRTIAIAVHWVINLDTFFRQLQIALALQARAGGVGHDSQSVPGEIFARAHFHLIAERQTSPHAVAWFSDVRGRSGRHRCPSLPLPSGIPCARSCSWRQSTFCVARANHNARKKWSVEKSTNQFHTGVLFLRSDFWQNEDFSAMFLSSTRRTLSYLTRTRFSACSALNFSNQAIV